MSQYADFNTTFSYKYVSTFVDSDEHSESRVRDDITNSIGSESRVRDDITHFGGWGEIDQEKGKGHWYWEDEYDDAVSVLQALDKLPFALPAFYNYNKDVDGTLDLLDMLSRHPAYKSDGEYKKFCLGCLIYHQTLYTPHLSVTFNV